MWMTSFRNIVPTKTNKYNTSNVKNWKTLFNANKENEIKWGALNFYQNLLNKFTCLA